MNPYVKIDEDYSEAVAQAVEIHEQAVSKANAQLALDLASADDEGERADILSEFDEATRPVREAYQKAVETASETRKRKKEKAEAEYDSYVAEQERERITKEEKADLVSKLAAGDASFEEIQTTLANILESQI